MMIHVTRAQHIEEYKVKIAFDDGSEGTIDLKNSLQGPIFEPLKDVGYFKQFHVDSDIQTLVWPNGADFAPVYLRDNLI